MESRTQGTREAADRLTAQIFNDGRRKFARQRMIAQRRELVDRADRGLGARGMGGIGVLPSSVSRTIEPDGGRYDATKGAATTLMV
jgi:hypothetical protein